MAHNYNVRFNGRQQETVALEDNKYKPLHDPAFDNFVAEVCAEFHIPGIAIAIVHGNETFSKGYGYAQLSNKDPVTPNTLFFTGSTTKSFVAAAFSKLVYSNETQYANIKWSTRLADLIRDDFVLQDEYATQHIRVDDALSHRTGMPRHDLTWMNADPAMRNIVRQMRHLPLHTELRTTWEYCNLMFTAVAHALEVITKLTMTEILTEWIWKPLGMQETFYDIGSALDLVKRSSTVNIARGNLWDEASSSFVEVPWSDIPPSIGAGGMISNVIDYTKWIQQFLQPHNSSMPLCADAVSDMTSAHMLKGPDTTHLFDGPRTYGLGLDRDVYHGVETVGHAGALAGYMTGMTWIPSQDWGVVVMENTYSFGYEIIKWRLVDDFLRMPAKHRKDVAGEYRRMQREMQEKVTDGRKRLFPDAPDAKHALSPALPLTAYAGVYHHPAYQNFTFSIPSEEASAEVRSLLISPMSKSYLDFSGTLYHVSSEHWWAHISFGPRSFMTDELWKAEFRVGVHGAVEGLRLQVEPAIDELLWFKKVA